MEKTLIEFDQSKYDSTVSSLNDTIANMQDVIKSFNTIGIGNFEKENLNDLIFNTEHYLFEKIMHDKPAVFAGMKINKQRFFEDYIEKPKGYEELLQECELFKKRTLATIKWHWPNDTLESYLKFFILSDNSAFEIKPEVLEKIKLKYERYLSTDKAKLAYEIALALKEFLSESKLIRITNQPGFIEFTRDLLKFADSGKADINVSYLQSLDYRQ